MCNKIPRPHAELIKAWADGAVIQYKVREGEWKDVYNNNPTWNEWETYRVKPEPKPDVVKYSCVHNHYDYIDQVFIANATSYKSKHNNIKLTFDGETGKLKKAEVIA